MKLMKLCTHKCPTILVYNVCHFLPQYHDNSYIANISLIMNYPSGCCWRWLNDLVPVVPRHRSSRAGGGQCWLADIDGGSDHGHVAVVAVVAVAAGGQRPVVVRRCCFGQLQWFRSWLRAARSNRRVWMLLFTAKECLVLGSVYAMAKSIRN